MEYGKKIADRERGSDLFEIVEGLQQKGKSFDLLLSRLITIGNKLIDESGEKTIDEKLPVVSKPSQPGSITNLNNCILGFGQLADRFEVQIAKLEKII